MDQFRQYTLPLYTLVLTYIQTPYNYSGIVTGDIHEIIELKHLLNSRHTYSNFYNTPFYVTRVKHLCDCYMPMLSDLLLSMHIINKISHLKSCQLFPKSYYWKLLQHQNTYAVKSVPSTLYYFHCCIFVVSFVVPRYTKQSKYLLHVYSFYASKHGLS